MALGVPAAASFWVGGKQGRLLHGDFGAIGARIERLTASAKALGLEFAEVAALLETDSAPRGEASVGLREQVVRIQVALAELREAGKSTVRAMTEAT